MHAKVSRRGSWKNIFVFLGVTLLFLILSPAQATCTLRDSSNISSQGGGRITARLNIEQVFPGSGQSASFHGWAEVECQGVTTLTMYSEMKPARWQNYYNSTDFSTARGIADVTITAPGSRLSKRYDLIRGTAGGNNSAMPAKANSTYTIDFKMASGQAQIISEVRHLSSPPAENNTIATILGAGENSTIIISSGLIPVLDYCTDRYFTHSAPESPINFGIFSSGRESAAYDRIKPFNIRVRSDSRCHRQVTPTVSFSHISGGIVGGNYDTIKLNNGLQFQLKQTSGSRPGRIVQFGRRTRHVLSSVTPGASPEVLSFDAVLSKQPGVPVTSGSFSAIVRYHLEYK